MGNKIKRWMLFLTMIISIVLFAADAPNEVITENPEKEVTTVESMKVRDKATMSLQLSNMC